LKIFIIGTVLYASPPRYLIAFFRHLHEMIKKKYFLACENCEEEK